MTHYKPPMPKRPIEQNEFLKIFHSLGGSTWALEQAVLLARLHGDKTARVLM